MEQRIYVNVPGLPRPEPGVPDEAWEPFITWLERHRATLGPVLGWDEHGGHVVVSGDWPDAAAAAGAALEAVVDALRATHLGHLFPSAVEIEPVPADELKTA